MVKQIFILDASALISGQAVFGEGVRLATTLEILDEVRSKGIQMRITGWLDTGVLMPMEPAPEYMTQAKQAAKQSGDLPVLSANDIKLLALALEVTKTNEGVVVTLLSGDFALENSARFLNLKVDSITPGIKKVIQWEWYCPACHKKGFKNPALRECDACGTPLKRRDASRRQQPQKPQHR